MLHLQNNFKQCIYEFRSDVEYFVEIILLIISKVYVVNYILVLFVINFNNEFIITLIWINFVDVINIVQNMVLYF